MAKAPGAAASQEEVDAARKAGYSDSEIADHLGAANKFDTAAARAMGYSDAEILDHFVNPNPFVRKDMTVEQARAETDAAIRADKTPALLREAGQGVALGFGDELDGGLAALETGGNNLIRSMTGQPSVGYGMMDAYGAVRDANRNAAAKFEKEHPFEAAGAQIAGAALSPEGRLSAAVVAKGGSALSRTARSAGVGAMTGGVYGTGMADGDMESRLKGGAIGAMTGAVTGAGLGGASEGGAAVLSKPPAPSLEVVTAAKKAAYNAADNSGVVFTPEAMKGLAADINTAMGEARFNPRLHTKAAPLLDQINADANQAAGYAPTLTELDQLRRQARDAVALSDNADEARIGRIIVGKIDDFVANAKPEQLSGGDAAAAPGLLARARELNTRVEKLRSLDNLEGRAADRAAVTGSGGNGENTLRQNVMRFKYDTPNLTPAESDAAQVVIDGTALQNGLRQVGKLSPEGNGLMTAGHLAALLPSHGYSVGIAALGAVSKRVAEAIAERNVAKLRALIANGGPEADEALQALSALEDASSPSGRMMTGVARRAIPAATLPATNLMTRQFAPN